MQVSPGQSIEALSAVYFEAEGGIIMMPRMSTNYFRDVLSSEKKRNTPEAPAEPAGKPAPTAASGADSLFLEEHHSTGSAEAAAAKEPPRRPTARIPDNPVLRAFYDRLPVADKNAIREVDRRFFEAFPQEAEPERARKYRDIPPGCEGIADISLAYMATWEHGSEKNSHIFQFLHGAPVIRDWIKSTFPKIKELYADDARHFIRMLHRYGMDFIRCLDYDFVDAKTGVGTAFYLGDVVGRVRTQCATLDSNEGTTVFLAGARLLRESGDYLPWKSKNPPTREEVAAACSPGNPSGYFQTLVRWSKLTPEEMAGASEGPK
jgi:hypothetical protein